MAAAVNKYGYTAAYGDGPYKGEPTDAILGVIKGVAWSEYRKCLHFGFTEEQGLGWAEDTDGDMPWPESQAAVMRVIDENAVELLVVFDERSGLPYVINTFTGPAGSKYVKRYKDKVDPNLPNSGTDVGGLLKFGEHYGADKEFILRNVEQRITLRPINPANRGADGYDELGLPEGFSIDAEMYADGDLVASAEIESVPFDSEYVFDHDVRGHTLQQKLIWNKGEFKLTRLRSTYTVYDVAEIPSSGNTTEADYQLEFSRPVLWLSRGGNLLLDRASGATKEGEITAIAGPDGYSNSAMSIGGDGIQLGNGAQAYGTLLLWAVGDYSIDGVTLTEFGRYGDWRLYYRKGSIPANITLAAGDVFDVRIYSTVLSDAAISDYFDDVMKHYGANYLPR